MNESCVLVIPAYEPEPIFIDVVQQLKPHFGRFIVVDDGSGESFRSIFQSIKKMDSIIVLEHKDNKGKGAALKTAFSYVIKNFPDIVSVIMCDADGQHLPKDVLSVTQDSLNFPHSFIFGTRTFSYANTPFRSWVGNTITQFILKMMLKTNLKDTQTGLRAYPFEYLQKFVEIPYDRYEYDTESIILMVKNHWAIRSVNIDTVYIDHNKSSHFNPVIDSLKIYWVILKYSLVSVLSFLIDLSIFSFMTLLNFSTFPSLFVSKFVSAIFNFTSHRLITFRSKATLKRTLISYAALWILNIVLGVYLIDGLMSVVHVHKILVKIFVDVLLFFFNFWVSKRWIFPSKG